MLSQKSKLPVIHSIPNEIVVPSPFAIRSLKESQRAYYKAPLLLNYGTVKMEVEGRKLNVKDCNTFIALTELATKKGTLEFETTLGELCGRLYKSYGENSKQSLRRSLKRLREATIEIITTGEKGDEDWIICGLISSAIKEGDTVSVIVDKWFNRLFGKQLMTSIDSQFRLSLKGDTTKQLYLFLQRQVSARKRQDQQPVKIGLEKLCELIGLDRDSKQSLPSKRFQIKKGLEELKKQKYLRSFSIQKDIVDVVIKTERTKRAESETAEKGQPARKEEEQILKLKGLPGADLLKHVEEQTGKKIRGNRDMARIKALQIQAVGKAIRNNSIFDDFAGWLKEQSGVGGWLKTISYGTLDSYKGPFSRFMSDMGFEMPSHDAVDREFKLLTESETEKKEREERRRREKSEEERRATEYEEDFRWTSSCVDDNLKDLRLEGISSSAISDMVGEIKKKHGQDWRSVFERFVKAVEQKHQEAQGGRSGSYPWLFRMGSKVWDEIVEDRGEI